MIILFLIKCELHQQLNFEDLSIIWLHSDEG